MIVCLFLVVVVLLQSGKAADLAGAFGGMGSQTVFGPRGSATVLSKATTDCGGAVHGDVADAVDHGDARVAERSGDCWTRRRSRCRRRRRPAAPQPVPPGQTVPIQVTPSVNGQSSGTTQTVPASSGSESGPDSAARQKK